jgi:tRNA(Ile)-lysidine synthase
MLTTVARSVQHCQEAESLLMELAAQDLKLWQTSKKSLSIKNIKNLSKARFNNLIRYFLQINQCLMPSAEQLEQAYNQLGAAEDKTPAVKVGHSWLRRFKGELYLTADYQDVSAWMQEIDLRQIQLPDQLGTIVFNVGGSVLKENQNSESESEVIARHQIIAPKLGQKVTVKFCHRNPKCLPEYRQHSRSLKKVLQELSIPPWQRQRLPFLYYDEQLVAVIGHFICKPFIPTEVELAMHISWSK